MNEYELHIATAAGNLDEVNRLIENGADVNAVNKYESTPLYIASRIGHHLVVEHLITVPGIDVNMANNYGETPLYIASQFGHLPVVERLLAVPGIDVNKASGGYTPLCIASQHGRHLIVERLLAHPGIDVDNAGAHTPLYFASRNGYHLVVEHLLAVPGIDVNMADNYGETPLYIASFQGHHLVVERLLAHPEIDVNKSNINGKTPLFVASQNGCIIVVEHLLAHPEIDVNKASTVEVTPLYIASSEGDFEIVERLLAVPGINMRKQTNFPGADGKRTALDIAIRKKYGGIIKLIKDALAAPPKRRPAYPVGLWQGFSDIGVLDSIFQTEIGPGKTRSDAENMSCCPVCFKIVPSNRAAPQTVSRESGCMYILDHNCSTLGGYFHKGLYNKYKDADGNICWCTICGRICQQSPNRHYALKLASKPKAATIEDFDASADDSFGSEADCIKYGGGGLKEKLMRYSRMREIVLELQDKIDKISFNDAIYQIVERTWNAPIKSLEPIIEKIAREKKWNIPNTEFKEFSNVTAPYPFAPVMVPNLEGMMNDMSELIELT